MIVEYQDNLYKLDMSKPTFRSLREKLPDMPIELETLSSSSYVRKFKVAMKYCKELITTTYKTVECALN